MRQGPNGRRPRGRHHGGGHGGGGHDRSNGNNAGNPNLGNNRPRTAASLRHQTFDSNCIDVRVRGNAWQVHEKYQALARDAQSSGDRVAAENYLQHAEHYYRIIEAINEATAAEQQVRGVAPTPFGQQPDMPSNYYGAPGAPSGNPAGAPGALQPNGNANPQPNSDMNGNAGQPVPMAEAQVQRPTPPPSPFFAPEETEDNGQQPLVARR